MGKKKAPTQAEWEKEHPPQVGDAAVVDEITTDYSQQDMRGTSGGSAPVEDELGKRFTYVTPKGDQPARYLALRAAGKALAFLIAKYCPPSRERELALTALDTVIMWANASIARREQ